jgi:hypothetical protein
MTINGILDRVDNPVTFTSNFQTAAGPDFTAPSVLWSSVSSSESIPTNSSITVQFSESMDVTTFTAAQPGGSGNFYIWDTLLGTYVATTLSWSADQSVAYLTPTSPLAAGRQYYLYVGGGTDLAGNSLSPTVYTTFYAQFTVATTAPTVVNFNPTNGATGLGTNVIIEAQFSAAIDPNSLGNVTLTTAGTPVPTTPSLGAGNTVLQLVPAMPLAPNTTYLFTIAGVKDPAGNLVATVTDSFTTGATFDVNRPAVVTTDPPNYATTGTNVAPKILFNKPLNPLTVNNTTFQIYLNDTSQYIPATVTLSANQLEVTIQPQIPLLPNTLYRYSGGWNGGPQDQDGNFQNLPWFYFYTGSGAVTSGPTVTAISPANGATAIPLNAQIVVTISAVIDPISWSQSSIQLLDSSNNQVAGTVSEPNNQTLAFVPTTNLLSGITYTVNVGGFTDANGNAAVPFSSQFVTGAAAATGGLTLTSTNIPSGAPDVSSTQAIVLTFSQILNPQSVSPSTLLVMNGWNSNLGQAGTYSVSGNQITFTPTSPYPAGATMYVGAYGGGPADVLGDTYTSPNSGCCVNLLNFTVISGTPDTSALQVVSVNPPSGATGVRHDIPVSVTFNKSISPYSIWNNNNALLFAGQGLVDRGSITMSADERTMTFNIGALSDGTTYTIALPAGGITDQSGNALANTFTSTFITATNPSTGNGSVTRVSPNWNASGIPTDTLLTLYLNRVVNPSTLSGNVVVTVNGQVYAGSVQAAASGYEVQFTPTVPFPNGAVVQWWFSNVSDTDGNAFNGNSGYFYTVAAVNPNAAPRVVAISPNCCGSSGVPTNAEIDIEYSLPIDATTLSGNVYINSGPATPFTVSLASPNVVRMTPSTPWNSSTWYGFCTNSSVMGTNGVAAQSYCWATYFTTAAGPDYSSGTVKIGPPNGAINVGTNAYIRLVFSKPVDVTSIYNANTVQVTSGGNPIDGTWSWAYSGNDIVGAYYSPVNPLPASSTIQVSINGILDYAGNQFTGSTTQFQTAAVPDFSAASVSLDFYNGAGGIATNASFTCRYSKPMDPSSITPSGTYVYSYVTNASVPVTYTFSSDLMSVTMTPTSPLFANSQYQYQCYNAIDLTGNGQSNNYAYFYTGNGASSAGPTLLQTNPPNGFTNVALNTNSGPWCNTSLGLLFNKPVAESSLGNITLTPQGGSPMPIGLCSEIGDTAVMVALPYNLQPNTTYTFNVTGVTDYAGNPITPVTSTFRTGTSFDWTPPTTVSTSPVNGDAHVDPNTSWVTMTFSEPMNPVIMSSSQIYLRNHNTQTTVPTTLFFSSDYTTVYLAPVAPLDPATMYDLVYWPNSWYLTDIAGNYDNNYGVWSTFTTGTPTPVNGACGTANGVPSSSAPTANLCSAGTPSPVTNTSAWTWTCGGQYGGTDSPTCSANVVLTAACDPQPSGLVSWWRGEGNANDQMGLNNGTLENGASFALGEVGDAFSLNGSNQYVLIGDPIPASLQIQNSITLSAWVYVTGLPPNSNTSDVALIVGSQYDTNMAGTTIFYDGRTDSGGVNGIPPGHITFQIGTGASWYWAQTQTQVPLNQWVLITATQGANSPAQIYFNGVLQPTIPGGTGSSNWSGAIPSYNGAWFAIGQQKDQNRPFNGLIDEVQIYNRALTASEVQTLYNASGTGVCASGAAATISVIPSLNSVASGAPVTFTATVSPNTATGTVTFMDGGTVLAAPVTISGGQAAYGTSALTTGLHTITAVYSGDSNFSASSSAPLTQLVESAQCAAPSSKPLGWWPANGNTNDIVGGNNGTIEGTVTYGTGEVGQAFSLAGGGDVSVPLPAINTAAGTQVTVSFWMNWNGSGSAQMPFGFTNYDLWLYSGSFGFNTSNSDMWGISSSGLAGQWVYVAAVFTNGDAHLNQLYINGVQQSLSQQFGSTPSSVQQVATIARIGSWNNGSYNFNGLIDEVQVYNRALSAAEVQSLYITGSAGYAAYSDGSAGICSLGSTSGPTLTVTMNPGNALVANVYSTQLSASGGTAPYTFALASGSSLPAGSTLSASGLISGTPTSPGTTTFTVQAEDTSIPIGSGTATAPITVSLGPNGSQNALLSGSYTWYFGGLKDADGSNVWMVGTITADGAGNLTSGTLDINTSAGSFVTTGSVTGSYEVGSD